MITKMGPLTFRGISIFILLSLILLSGISAEAAIASPTLSISSQSKIKFESLSYSLQTVPMTNVANLSNAAISAVQSGSTSISNITLGPSSNLIGTNVSIDVRVDNVSVGVWGWAVATVNWNSSILNLTSVQKGPFLSDNPGGDSTFFLGSSKSTWDNLYGQIFGGLSEAISGTDTSPDSSGILATLTFNVTSYGNSSVTIGGGSLRTNSSDSSAVNVTCNSATVALLNSPSSTSSPSPSPSSTPTLTPTPTAIQTSNSTSTLTSTSTTSPTPTATPIPEFSTWAILTMFIILIFTSFIFVWRKGQIHHNSF